VLVHRRQRLAGRQHQVLADAQERLDALDQERSRLLEVEERLGYAERMLVRQRESKPQPPE
jgi:hypothetical protein